MGEKGLDARAVAVTAVMIAVVAAFTIVVRIPIPGSSGYFNFSDVAVFFVAFTFGPIPALVAGGVGAAIADVAGGYAQFAPISFVAHGLEGLLAGYLARRGAGPAWTFLGWLVGSAAMLVGYFLGDLVLGGMPAALADLLPANLAQVVVGGIVGTALTAAVRQAYPPIAQVGRPRTVQYRDQ